MSNEKQLGLAYLLYVQDSGIMDISFGTEWPWALEAYHSNERRIRICPATPENKEKREGFAGGEPFRYFWGRADLPYLMRGEGRQDVLASYGMNAWLRTVQKSSSWMVPLYFKNEATVAFPSRTPIFGDSFNPAPQPRENDPPTRDLYFIDRPGQDAIGHYTMGRHGRGGPLRASSPIAPGHSLAPWVNQIVFFDGHSERVRLDDLWNVHWHREWKSPSIRPQ